VPGHSNCAWDVVARDSTGEVVKAKTGRPDQTHDAFSAELQAMEEAINLTAELGVIHALF
jgi:hypothetical protein